MEPDARCMMNAVIVTVPHTRETLKRVPLRPSAHVFLFPQWAHEGSTAQHGRMNKRENFEIWANEWPLASAHPLALSSSHQHISDQITVSDGVM